jgi:asparagine synthase (glutamine-hydrolysing)
MCGICGIYNFKTKQPVPLTLLKDMADTMSHRGPDDKGFYISGETGLGHRRLSIIDLGGGHQPMSNEDGTVWVVFNGEIYNFKELYDGLLKKGHIFKTRSDTEAIIHMYEEKGEECFQYFRGMFAIAIWDEKNKRLLLARDRVGKKPLFYFYDGNRIVFASEIKGILKAQDISQEIDLEALSDYFSFLYVPVPKSIYKKIRKIRPGHYALIDDTGFRESEYWDIRFAHPIELSEERWGEELLEVYRESIRIRLISDVPLGAFLSGGVDSSSVVALMSDIQEEPVLTSSIGFDEQEFNELNYAREVSSLFNTNHYEKVVRPDAVGIVHKLAWHYDEPFADSSAVPTYYVSKVAREKVTVALSGDGGDENFAGYRRYYFDARENRFRSLLPIHIRRPVFRTLASLYPKADWAPRVFRGKATFEALSCAPLEGYFRSVSAVRPELKGRLLHPDVKRSLSGYDSLNVFKFYYEKADTDDPLSRIQYLDIKTYLTDDILVKVDRASMANSLEVRAPLLDHKFMELVATIPSSLKLQGRNGKYIFKKTLEGVLPKEILYRKKMGFGVPLARWFRNELKDLAYETIFNNTRDDLFQKSTVEQIWRQHQNGFRDRSTPLWTLFMFRLWQQQFTNNRGHRA